MGRKLSTTTQDSKPIVSVKETKGQFFIGVREEHRQVESQFKNEDGTNKKFDVYDFLVEDTDMALLLKEGKEYVIAKVEVGASVAITYSFRLNNALKQTSAGDRIKFVYMGLGKATKFGAKPHEYEVEVL